MSGSRPRTTATPGRWKVSSAFVDMARGEVLEILDTGVVPIPPEKGSYYPEDNGPLRSRSQAP